MNNKDYIKEAKDATNHKTPLKKQIAEEIPNSKARSLVNREK